jgi:hypothetical protein
MYHSDIALRSSTKQSRNLRTFPDIAISRVITNGVSSYVSIDSPRGCLASKREQPPFSTGGAVGVRQNKKELETGVCKRGK